MKIYELKKDQRIIRCCIGLILLLIILASVFLDPDNYSITDCAFKHLTGLSCPGCGLTRSFHAFARFQILEAFAYHLMGPIFLLGFFLLFFKYLVETITGKTFYFTFKAIGLKTVLLILGITWLGFWLCRMIYEML